MLTGEAPEAERVRGLETYLNTVVDHGFNASTFTCRVIASTGSDLVSAVVGAIGALKGPLHGGAPGPALDMVFEIGEAARAEAVLRAKIEAGERLMGFGHRVYRVRDPRADVLAAAAERLYTPRRRHGALRARARQWKRRRCACSTSTSRAAGCRPTSSSTPRCCCTASGSTRRSSRRRSPSAARGWIAHAIEQQRTGRLIRPQSEYVGPRSRTWVPIESRTEGAEASATLG